MCCVTMKLVNASLTAQKNRIVGVGYSCRPVVDDDGGVWRWSAVAGGEWWSRDKTELDLVGYGPVWKDEEAMGDFRDGWRREGLV